MREDVPAPPTRFRCNRGRMLLSVKVTLHHIGANQINLKTSRSKIELDTMRAHRKFVLSREYPRGIECDDTKTTARLEHGHLIVEMPITKLPTVVRGGASNELELEASPAVPATGKLLPSLKGSTVSRASSGKHSMEDGARRPGGGVHGSGKAKKRLQAEADEAASTTDQSERRWEQPERGVKAKKPRSQSKAGTGKSSETEKILKALSEAVDSEASRHQGYLAKMKRVQAADAAAEEHKKAKEVEREQKKKQLLDSFKKQKQARKEALKKETLSETAVTKQRDEGPPKKKKRVSFKPKITDE